MRHLPFASLALATMLLSGCDKTSSTSGDPAPGSGTRVAVTPATPANVPAGAASPTCPATDFAGFLPKFMNDVATQKAFVTDPLQSDSVDPNAEPEPKPVSKMVGRADITFPVMPSEGQQAKDDLKLTKNETSATEVIVKLARQDTDYQMSFFFRKDGCWHLYRVKDDSL
ncbi:MAG: hypothetical protein ABWX83_16060 [Luteibacter sp.]